MARGKSTRRSSQPKRKRIRSRARRGGGGRWGDMKVRGMRGANSAMSSLGKSFKKHVNRANLSVGRQLNKLTRGGYTTDRLRDHDERITKMLSSKGRAYTLKEGAEDGDGWHEEGGDHEEVNKKYDFLFLGRPDGSARPPYMVDSDVKSAGLFHVICACQGIVELMTQFNESDGDGNVRNKGLGGPTFEKYVSDTVKPLRDMFMELGSRAMMFGYDQRRVEPMLDQGTHIFNQIMEALKLPRSRSNFSNKWIELCRINFEKRRNAFIADRKESQTGGRVPTRRHEFTPDVFQELEDKDDGAEITSADTDRVYANRRRHLVKLEEEHDVDVHNCAIITEGLLAQISTLLNTGVHDEISKYLNDPGKSSIIARLSKKVDETLADKREYYMNAFNVKGPDIQSKRIEEQVTSIYNLLLGIGTDLLAAINQPGTERRTLQGPADDDDDDLDASLMDEMGASAEAHRAQLSDNTLLPFLSTQGGGRRGGRRGQGHRGGRSRRIKRKTHKKTRKRKTQKKTRKRKTHRRTKKRGGSRRR